MIHYNADRKEVDSTVPSCSGQYKSKDQHSSRYFGHESDQTLVINNFFLVPCSPEIWPWWPKSTTCCQYIATALETDSIQGSIYIGEAFNNCICVADSRLSSSTLVAILVPFRNYFSSTIKETNLIKKCLMLRSEEAGISSQAIKGINHEVIMAASTAA